ncbi:hypothetical protein NQ318_022830 [Aromia moschata]|uniref:Uncharacterized protein n=1 Tax=Aromia moschata TaxID=1265417 RepID=A0AAV8XUM8_9CUCU|nr:hypothetical protein NQ318_022830 [Aromia moschata]
MGVIAKGSSKSLWCHRQAAVVRTAHPPSQTGCSAQDLQQVVEMPAKETLEDRSLLAAFSLVLYLGALAALVPTCLASIPTFLHLGAGSLLLLEYKSLCDR